MEAENKILLLHTKVQCLLRGKVLARVYHLINKLIIFLNDEQQEEARILASDN